MSLSFDDSSWRSQVRQWWRDHADDWREQVATWRGQAARMGDRAAFAVLVAGTFVPLLQQVPADQLPAIFAAITSGLGTNLLANLIQRMHDRQDAAPEDVIRAVVEAAAEGGAVCREVEAVIDRARALDASSEALGEAWDDFAELLLADLRTTGGSSRLQGTVATIRDVRMRRDTAGRDVLSAGAGGTVIRQGDVVHYGPSTEDLAKVIAALAQVFARPDSRIEGSMARDSVDVSAGTDSVSVRRQALLEATPGTRQEWLTKRAGLQVFERLKGFVPLAGLERMRPDLDAIENVEQAGGQRSQSRRRIPDLLTALSEFERFVLLGEPGRGKSTLLDAIERDYLQRAAADFDGTDTRIPLRVDLGDHRDGAPQDFLRAEWDKDYRDGLGLTFDEVFGAGRMLILADGLNEMPRDRIDKQAIEWGAWVDSTLLPDNWVIFACRTNDRVYAEPLRLPRVEILPMSPEKVREFVDLQLEPDLAERVMARLDVDDRACRSTGRAHRSLLALAGTPLVLFVMAEEFKATGDLSANRGQLFTRFCQRLLEREIEKEDRRLTGAKAAARAIRESLSELAYAMQAQRQSTRFLKKVALAALAPGDDGETTLERAVGARLLRGIDRDDGSELTFAHQLFQEALAAQALLRRFRMQEGEAGFKDVRDLWSGKRLKDAVQPRADAGEWDALLPPDPTGWEETTILAAGLANRDRNEGRNAGDLPALIEAIRARNPILAARCLDESDEGLLDDGPEALQRTIDALRRDLVADLGDPNVHLRARIESGKRLGRIGDARFRPFAARGGSPFVAPSLCKLEAGAYLVGNPGERSDRRFDVDAFDDEQGGAEVDLPEFWIGRYPVTNAEFRCFVEAGGYREDRWWDDAGRRWRDGGGVGGLAVALEQQRLAKSLEEDWRHELEASGSWRPEDLGIFEALRAMSEDELTEVVKQSLGAQRRDQPLFWDDPAYADWTGANQPVIGVSWHEARAYCRWLNARCQASGTLTEDGMPATYVLRLPTEAEWEAAARGPEGQHYPWGSEFSTELANTIEGRVLRVSPVGAYPDGAATCGALDLSGNVWEWTLSLWGSKALETAFGYPYRGDDGREDESADDDVLRVVRGGSWGDLSWAARCAYRGGGAPHYRFNLLGFRVVVAPPTSGR